MVDHKQLKHEIGKYVDAVWGNVVADIATLVAIPSIDGRDAALPHAPWGPGPQQALEAALTMASRLGLVTHNRDGYIGYADFVGASPKHIAIMTHLDVVPPGSGWHADPYVLQRRDGYLIGRGVIDNKGPAVLSMWAANFFVRRGVELPYTLRLIFGVNEETSMDDAKWYVEHEPAPSFLFTPDSAFPVCYGEKGLYLGTFTYDREKDGRIIDLCGGTAHNVVPGSAYALVKAEAADLPSGQDITIQDQGEGCVRIEGHGIAGHASMPEGARNAIQVLIDYLLAHDICSEHERRFLNLEQEILGSFDGSTLDIDAADDVFDPLTCVGGTVKTTPSHFIQSVDIRFPKSISAERIMQALNHHAKQWGATFSTTSVDEPFFLDPESPEIQTLAACYNEYAQKEAKPFTMGGGTYARHFSRAVSFGLLDPAVADQAVTSPEWVGGVHSPDEGIAEAELRRALAIYIYAIARLMELDW